MRRKGYFLNACIIFMLISLQSFAQKAETPDKPGTIAKAASFVAALSLTDTAKAARVTNVIALHMAAVRDWHNSHPYTLIPAGVDPVNGKVFTQLQRQFIIDSTIPATVHNTLMTGLRNDLTEDQVAILLDKYTIGKLDFTMNGYKAIVTDMTAAEQDFILKELKAAREEAVDYKDVKNEMSNIFKIHKTRIEDYFYGNGRNWKTLYKTYVDKILATKKAGGTDKSTAVEN